MPFYDYKCEVCDKEWEAIHSIKDRNTELCKCGEQAGIVMRPSTVGSINYNYFDNALGVQITNPEQRKRLIKEKGLFEL